MATSVPAHLLEALIAAMIQVIPPGYSMYSQVPIDYCGEACQQTPLCEDVSLWRCKPPRFDPAIYQSKVQELREAGSTFEAASEAAKPLSYTRPESYDEGLVRYQIIAEAVTRSALRMTQGVCRSACKKTYAGNADDYTSCRSYCLKYAPWKYSYKELAYLTITVWGMESGFRADVHGGVSPAGRGDCGYFKANKQVSPKTPGARRLCRSVCLGQINMGMGYTMVATKRWTADDIVGIDLASTERCAMASQSVLARAREFCTSPWSGQIRPKDWAAGVFSLYGSGNRCDVPKLGARSNLFWKLMKTPPSLAAETSQKLLDPRLAAATSFLRSASPVLWTVPLQQYAVVPDVGAATEPAAQAAAD